MTYVGKLLFLLLYPTRGLAWPGNSISPGILLRLQIMQAKQHDTIL